MKILLLAFLVFLAVADDMCESNWQEFCGDNNRRCKNNECGKCLKGHSTAVSFEEEMSVAAAPVKRKTIVLDGNQEENCKKMSNHMKRCLPFDASFIMDSSGSICGDGKDAVDENGECVNFNHLESFVSETIDSSTKSKMRASLIQFANYALMKVRFGQVQGKQNLKNMIEQRFVYTEGRTNMEQALRMYMDEVLPLHADDETVHNVYILTDGVPTDNPCSLAEEFNKRTYHWHINVFIVLVKDWRGAERLSCLDATFIKVRDFDSLTCPTCKVMRTTCDNYTCKKGYSQKTGEHFCIDEDCSSPDNREVCCDADLCHQLARCQSYDATFLVDSSGSICTKSMLRDANNECANFNMMEDFVAQSISASTKEDMKVGMVRFAGTPYLRRPWSILQEETLEDIHRMVDEKLQWFGGMTDMGEAIDLYHERVYMKGWKGAKGHHNLYFLTDGVPTDDVCARADKFNKMVSPQNLHAFIILVGFKQSKAAKVRVMLGCLDAKILEVHKFADLQCESCHGHCKAGPQGKACQNGGVVRNVDDKCECDCSETDFAGAWCEMKEACTTGINGLPCQNNGVPSGDGENCKCECPQGYVGYNCQYHTSEVLWVTPATFSGYGKFFAFKDTEADRLTGMRKWYKKEWNIITEHNRQGKIKIYKNSRGCDECGRYRDTPTVNDFADEKWIYFVNPVIKDDSVTSCHPKSKADLEAMDELDVGMSEEGNNVSSYLMLAAACVFALGAGYHYGTKVSA